MRLVRRCVVGVVTLSIAAALAGVGQPVGAATTARLRRAWAVRVGPAGRVATPVIYRGRAITTDASFVTAVGVDRGKVRWQVDHTDAGFDPLFLGLPSLVNGEIWVPFSVGRFGGLAMHDPKTGSFTTSSSDIIDGHIVTYRGSTATVYGGIAPGLAFLALQYGGEQPGLIDVTSSGLNVHTDPVFASLRHVWVGYGSSLLQFDPSGVCVDPPADVPFCMPNARIPLAGNVVGIARGPNRTVVATTDNGVVQVFNGATGAELWRASPGSRLATPAVSADVVAVGGADGKVHAYNVIGCGAAECAPLWGGDAGAAIGTAPAIADGLVYVGTAVGSVSSFAVGGCAVATCPPVASGHVWKPSALTGGPVVDGGTVVVGTADGHLVGFRAP